MKASAVKILILCAAALYCLPLSAAGAASPEGVRITDAFDSRDGWHYRIDMPSPSPLPEQLYQYKLETVRFSASEVEKAAAPYMGRFSSDRWVYNDTTFDEGHNFSYEPNFEYSRLRMNMGFPVFQTSYDENDPLLQSVLRTARAVLDALNIEYEYPFYTVQPIYQTRNNPYVHIESMDELMDAWAAASGGALSEGVKARILSMEAQNDPDYFVMARFLVDGIPLNISDSTPMDQSKYDSDRGCYAKLRITQSGEISALDVSGYCRTAAKQPEPRSVLGIDEAIEALRQQNFSGSGKPPLPDVEISGAEFCLSVNRKGNTYPVWRFFCVSDRKDELEQQGRPYTDYDRFISYNHCINALIGAR